MPFMSTSLAPKASIFMCHIFALPTARIQCAIKMAILVQALASAPLLPALGGDSNVSRDCFKCIFKLWLSNGHGWS
eukprot:5890444-Karenia_brevis.AAC.1